MRRSANRRAAPAPRSRRLLAAVGALLLFGALIGVTQISNAEDNETTAGKTVNGLEILANDCSDSELTPHDGFQNGDRCVSTEFGELASADKNPTLLITEAPRSVRAGQPFRLKVSTRNLVRDRFLAAGKGGYYVESSVLNAEGLVRGHFHTACRMLSSTREANDPAPVPAFFVATEDGKGGGQPDTVTIEVPGMPTEGTAQCASWAGDGSHRIPMMQRANQTPAFDAVRIRVRGQQPPAEEPPAEQPPAEQPPAEQPPAEQPPAEQPPAEQPPAEEPPAEQPPAEQPPAQQPPAEQPPAEQPPAEQPPADSGNGGGNQPPAEEEGDGATAPANPPAVPTSQPTTKSTVKRDNPPPATNNDTDSADTSDSSDADNTPAAPKSKSGAEKSKTSTSDEAESDTAEAPKPKPSASSKAAADLQSDEDTGAPDEEIDTQAAEPAPAPASANRLALTGVNSVAMICGGALLVLIGLIVINSMRRRRPHWR